MERADYILNELKVAGRSPAQWLELAQQYNGDLPVSPPPSPVRLDLATLHLYEAAGVVPSAQDLFMAFANAANIPLLLQDPVAELVDTVATAYAEQTVIAQTVARRLSIGENAPMNPRLLRPEEREDMAQRAARIVDAINLFHARLKTLEPANLDLATPTCLAPLSASPGDTCLAYLGSTGNDDYAPNAGPLPDPILIIEPEGDDLYTNSAAGANPLLVGGVVPGNGLALSVIADFTGDDDYLYEGEPSVVQGAGYAGGLGLLYDYEGADLYLYNATRSVAPNGFGFILNDDGGAQGYGDGAFGLLLDVWGEDRYDSRVQSTDGNCIFGYTQGWGGHGGLGIASDLWDDDVWIGTGSSTDDFSDTGCFVGVYNQGTGLVGGIGILTDKGRSTDFYLDYDNATSTDYYSQGFAGFSGLGILYDDGGNDTYVAESHGTDVTVNPALNCAFGTASAGGIGILIDDAGNDYYYADTTSDKGAVTMVEGAGDVGAGYGLFIDRAGTDHHEALASSTGTGFVGIFGRGVFDSNNFAYNVAGTYLDLGGATDTYTPIITNSLGDQAKNTNTWKFGRDE